MQLADMDGDGDLDLILGTNGPNGVQLNNGNGSFGARTLSPFPPFSNTRSIAVGDVNRDGYLDFVAANFAGPARIYVNAQTTGRAVQRRIPFPQPEGVTTGIQSQPKKN